MCYVVLCTTKFYLKQKNPPLLNVGVTFFKNFMILQSKYNFRDKLFMMHNNRIEEVEVWYININYPVCPHLCKQSEANYVVKFTNVNLHKNQFAVKENNLFKTKEELYASIA